MRTILHLFTNTFVQLSRQGDTNYIWCEFMPRRILNTNIPCNSLRMWVAVPIKQVWSRSMRSRQLPNPALKENQWRSSICSNRPLWNCPVIVPGRIYKENMPGNLSENFPFSFKFLVFHWMVNGFQIATRITSFRHLTSLSVSCCDLTR